MTDYNRFLASAPAGIIELRCLEISHPLFAAPLRLVHDYQDWTVTLETSETVTFKAAQFRTTPPTITDNGQIERGLQIDNTTGDVVNLLLPVVASTTPVTCTFRTYLSDDVTAPVFDTPEVTNLHNIQLSKGTLTASAQSSDVINRRFPRRIYTRVNTPGLNR